MYSVSRCVRVCGISQLYVTIVTKRLCWCYFEAPNHSSCMFTYLAVGLIPDSYNISLRSSYNIELKILLQKVWSIDQRLDRVLVHPTANQIIS